MCVVCRYSALSGGAGISDISDARNRSIGRSVGSSSLVSAASGRDYQGRMSGPSSRSSLTPRSSQEKNFDTPLTSAPLRYVLTLAAV